MYLLYVAVLEAKSLNILLVKVLNNTLNSNIVLLLTNVLQFTTLLYLN